jgi:hypothetical protein
MSWTYDDTLATDRDWVRFRTGSTNDQDQDVSNEEIDAVLAAKPDKYLAALEVARSLLAKFSRDFDRSNLGMSASRSQRMQHLKDVISELKAETATNVEPGWSGQSEADKESVYSDSDFIQCPFTRDRHTYK